ncbi:hypothetical protein NQ317_008665 [Molorchus minor]|uniref:phosphoribosylglycinamide formyltransferase 1 n=1 Tax=Molorchus minor TaxID=1323400 RepID=A0ABQ9K306_9CUCU|nr:hypothetical protein NQ317_008665 [Molorchus minor]
MEKAMRPFVPDIIEKHSVPKKRVGVLVSGSGTNLQALIDATQDPTRHIGAEIVLVISNKPNVEGLRRAERANIPTKVLVHNKYPNRAEFDRVLHNELVNAGVEIVCLAGFMRILTGEFTAKWKGRLLNVHPALLPLFKGVEAQRQALESGVRVSGCTVHFVEEDVDAGAIIVQESVPIEIGNLVETLVERIKTAEHTAFPRALQLVATGKSDDKVYSTIYEDKTKVFHHLLTSRRTCKRHLYPMANSKMIDETQRFIKQEAVEYTNVAENIEDEPIQRKSVTGVRCSPSKIHTRKSRRNEEIRSGKYRQHCIPYLCFGIKDTDRYREGYIYDFGGTCAATHSTALLNWLSKPKGN